MLYSLTEYYMHKQSGKFYILGVVWKETNGLELNSLCKPKCHLPSHITPMFDTYTQFGILFDVQCRHTSIHRTPEQAQQAATLLARYVVLYLAVS